MFKNNVDFSILVVVSIITNKIRDNTYNCILKLIHGLSNFATTFSQIYH